MRRLSWMDLIYVCLHYLLGFSVGLLTFSSTWIIYRHFSLAEPGATVVLCIVSAFLVGLGGIACAGGLLVLLLLTSRQ